MDEKVEGGRESLQGDEDVTRRAKKGKKKSNMIAVQMAPKGYSEPRTLT